MKTIVKLAAAVAVLGAAVPAVAGPGVRTTSVAYDDLDLSKAEAAATLERRIEVAARRVCGAPQSAAAAEIALVNGCRRVAVDEARPAMELALGKARKGTVEILVAASR